MKQLLILSGKGGTGKTTIASAFIKLAGARVYADCDVDAPNLHLIAGWQSEPARADYYGLPKAEIDEEQCIACGQCQQYCRFDAILSENKYEVNAFACEGCGVCEYVCPADAIALVPTADGELMLYSDAEKVFSTARLRMGSGTSGLLVTEVKNRMQSRIVNAGFAIIDGSPGIGCPVIASLNGVDMVFLVAEPSISGISDMVRIIKTAAQFGVRIAVCINKYDTNPEHTDRIAAFCQQQSLPVVGRIPFDTDAVKAINNGQTIVDIDCISGRAVKGVYAETISLLFEDGGNGK